MEIEYFLGEDSKVNIDVIIKITFLFFTSFFVKFFILSPILILN